MSSLVDKEKTTVPLRGIRGAIATKMLSSLQSTAQLTHHAEANVSFLNARKVELAEAGIKVSVEDLLIELVVNTLADHPDLNGHVVGKEIHLFSSINVSIAMALPGNLLVAPAIFDAQDKTLEELSSARRDLSARSKTNKLTVSEMTNGTFTVSNLGLSRVQHFTPILNAPQIAILGVGCATDRPVKSDKGEISLAPFIGLSLTFDHRAVDGAPAAEFLSDLCRRIEGA